MQPAVRTQFRPLSQTDEDSTQVSDNDLALACMTLQWRAFVHRRMLYVSLFRVDTDAEGIEDAAAKTHSRIGTFALRFLR